MAWPRAFPLLAVPFREYNHSLPIIAVTSWAQIAGTVQIRILAGRLTGIDLPGGCRKVLFCAIREEISGGLYDDPHRILRFVHVQAEMASIPREKMRCLASLCRGKHSPIFLRE